MNTNSAELKRFIRLPAEVKACEWQTGKFAKSGGDWWVAAVLDVGADQMDQFLRGPSKRELFETPPGLELKSSFSTLQSLPDAQITDSGGVRVAVDTFSVAPYASSPLLNGSVLKLSAGRLLVVLWTR